jgi:2'-5' RNA ligase
VRWTRQSLRGFLASADSNMPELKTLYTLCYPRLSDADRRLIEEFRREHDIPFRDVVAPHFTMVFGCSDVPLSIYLEHVNTVARSQRDIHFSCRYAMVGSDDENEYYYVFLTPDEGYSEISKLHDKLYRGPLAAYLRLDIPYVPHIAIATIPDAVRIKELCDALNSASLAIHGRIEDITVGTYDGTKITDLESFPCLK